MEEDNIGRKTCRHSTTRVKPGLRKSMLGSLMLGTLFAILTLPAQAISTLAIDESLTHVNLSNKVEYYKDVTGQLTYEQVMLVPEDQWQTRNLSVLSLGFTDSTYWFRLRIKSNAVFKIEPIISISNPHFATVNLYNIINGQVTQYLKAGSSVPFNQKLSRHRYPILPLKLSPTSESTILIQTSTQNTYQMSLELWSADEFQNSDQTILLIQGVYLGIWIIMLMCNLILAIAFHRNQVRGHNGFVSFILFFGLFQITLYGIGGSEFWSRWPNLFNITNIYTIGFSIISACWCIIGLLGLRSRGGVGLATMLGLATGAGLLMLAYPYVPLYQVVYLLHVLVALAASASLVLVSMTFFSGKRPNLLPLSSWVLMMVSLLGSALSRLAWIPHHPFWTYGASILFIFMIITTTIIVIMQITRRQTGTLEDVLNYEKKARQDQMLLNKRLEHDFRNKTQDLSQALSKLSETNKTLLEISTSDSVTGIKNRHFFDDIYDIEWKRASRQGYSICLMMADIDHFKEINDTYGHPVGDICLRDVADAIKRSLRRPSDVVARYGGEEFILVLPYLSMENGQILGERIRSEVEALMTVTGGHMIQLTISVGIATTIPTDGTSPDTLVEMADKALYQAKQEGRNRVCIAETA